MVIWFFFLSGSRGRYWRAWSSRRNRPSGTNLLFLFFKQFFLVIFKFQIYLLQGDRGGSGPKGSHGSQGEFVSYFLYPPLPCRISIISWYTQLDLLHSAATICRPIIIVENNCNWLVRRPRPHFSHPDGNSTFITSIKRPWFRLMRYNFQRGCY